MKWLLTLALLLSAASGVYLPDVTARDFDKLIDPSQSHVLVEFYAPWCGHCKALAPEFERLGKVFAKSSAVTIAQVDADKHKKLAKRFKVQGFPTMKWVSKGGSLDKMEDVNERTAEGLIKFVNEKSGLRLKEEAEPSNVQVLTPDDFDSTIASKHVFVGFFAPWCGHCKAIKPVWEQLATLFAHDKSVAIASVDADAHKDLAERYEVSGFPTIKLFKHGVEEPVKFEGARELDELLKFVNTHAGTDLTPDGGVTSDGGVVKELERELSEFKNADSDEQRVEAIKSCANAVQGMDQATQSKFVYYERVLNKVVQHGAEYIAKEKRRLSDMLDANAASLQAATRRNFQRRVNVLSHYDEL